jgi:antitoxin YefM
MKTLPLTEVRRDLPNIVDEVLKSQEHVVITKHGKPAAVVMSSDEFESWQETIEILSDASAMRALRQSERDIKAGRVHRWEDVKKRLRR